MQNLQQQFQNHYLKSKNFFLIFYCISEICIKFFKKKIIPSLIISEIIDAERRGMKRVESCFRAIEQKKLLKYQHGTTITLFSHQFEVNRVPKSHLLDMKS